MPPPDGPPGAEATALVIRPTSSVGILTPLRTLSLNRDDWLATIRQSKQRFDVGAMPEDGDRLNLIETKDLAMNATSEQISHKTTGKLPSVRVLVADDDPDVSAMIRDALEEEGYAVESASTGQQAISMIRNGAFDLVLCDVQMPDGDGVDVLRWIKQAERGIPIIMVTGNATVENAIEAMKLGAWEYLQKPFSVTELIVQARHALENSSLRRQNALLRRQVAAQYDFKNLIGDSRAIRDAMDRVRAVADVSASVLLTGESGSGKELFARAIHYNGPRSSKPLVVANIDAIPPDKIEAELFGRVSSKENGSEPDVRGLFAEANGSTLVLEEVAALPLHVQPKVLRAIQDGVITPVGSTVPRTVSVRVIACTSRDIEGEVVQGSFREDLYYSLKMVSVTVPSLRERREDIIPLALHFLTTAAAEHDRPARNLSEAARKALVHRRWPGNVRELKNIIQQAVILSQTEVLDVADLHLPESDNGSQAGDNGAPSMTIPAGDLTLREIVNDVVAQVERWKIREALERTDGNRTRAAAQLGISLRSLMYKLKEHEIG